MSRPERPSHPHECLHVYRQARGFNRLVRDLLARLPRGSADTAKQLRRAATSIMRNIAEGSGEWVVNEKLRFYGYARRSATECAAILDECVDYGLLRKDEVREAEESVGSVLAMLLAMMRSIERRDQKNMRPSPPPRGATRT